MAKQPQSQILAHLKIDNCVVLAVLRFRIDELGGKWVTENNANMSNVF